MTKPNEKKKILIVDDHPIVRRGIIQLIDNQKDLMVCGQAESIIHAMETIETTQPDLAIVDISLKNGGSGIELIKSIKSQYARLPTLVLSMHDESLYAERALRAGARGYFMKHESPEKLLMAIHQVLEGRIFVSDKMQARIMSRFAGKSAEENASQLDPLSDRELEVFQMIGQGFGTRQIAKELFRSVKTIEAHRANIKQKLDLKSAVELVRHAVKWVEEKH